MGQLTSPPVSARAVADWLISRCRSDKPLGTLSLLLSETGARTYENPVTGVEREVPEATADNVSAAIQAWAGRANEDVRHRSIFYFCGHGIAAGVTTSLLLADFGHQPLNKFDGAIDFDALFRGMDSIRATEQLFVVDACRVADPRLLPSVGAVGRVALDQTVRNKSEVGVRQPASLFSTMDGERAFGLPGAPSVYSAALVTALEGAGSLETAEDTTRWRVDTTLLQRAIDQLLKRRADMGLDDFPRQIPSSHILSTFPIHDLDGLPHVPVFVRCVDRSENRLAAFSCTRNGAPVNARPEGHAEDWEVDVEPGEYEFIAHFPATGAERRRPARIRPTYGDVKLEPPT
jgi:hypothetical protein